MKSTSLFAGLSAVLADVEEKGETFLICRNGHPVAELIPHVQKSRLSPHPVVPAKNFVQLENIALVESA